MPQWLRYTGTRRPVLNRSNCIKNKRSKKSRGMPAAAFFSIKQKVKRPAEPNFSGWPGNRCEKKQRTGKPDTQKYETLKR
jgi:hypothetical protein